MFLNYKTSDGHKMATAYCGLQKSLRIGNENSALYWAGQIGKSRNHAKGYPNALKKRLCQNALEDAGSWMYASRLLEEVPNGKNLEFEQLVPWVRALVKLTKTHSTAWLNRVAAQRVYEGYSVKGEVLNVNIMSEVDFAVGCLVAHRDGDIATLRSACGHEGDVAVKLYKFTNNDPLVFHAWQMHQRRSELSCREIRIVFDHNEADLSDVLDTRQELPLEWYDKHTKEGKEMGRGYAHFFEIMELNPRVYDRDLDNCGNIQPNACVRGGNDPYESEAKDLYLDFLLDGNEARVRHILNPSTFFKKKGKKKRSNSDVNISFEKDDCVLDYIKDGSEEEIKGAEKNDKRMKTEEFGVHNSENFSNVSRDVDVVAVSSRDGLIGFKNFTVIGELRKSLPGLSLNIGDPIFVKIGESYETCLYAHACDKLRGKIGMVSMGEEMTIAWLVPTMDVVELACRTNPIWASPVTKRVQKAKNSYSNSDGAVPAIVMGAFNGQDLCQRKEWLIDGMELLKVLIFRKYVGSADTNGKNVMINEAGRVFSVDETMATAEQLKKYKAKGLVTGQKIHSELLEVTRKALYERPQEVADFIDAMMELEIPIEINQSNRLSKIHNSEPFDTQTRAILRSHSIQSLVLLARRLNLE